MVTPGAGAFGAMGPWAPDDESCAFIGGGGDRARTDDPLLAKQVLSQLSYTPGVCEAATAPTGVTQ